MKTIPFWLDDFPRPSDLPTAPLPERVDVAIVGSGYTGLSAARTLAKEGVNVAVLEQRHIGGGASSVNGGQVGPGVKLKIEKVFKQFGPELGREIWQATIDAITYLEQTLHEENIDCDYHHDGYLATAYRPSHYADLGHYAEWMARNLDFHKLELLPADQMQREIGSEVYFGALIEEIGGGLQPAKFVFGLAQAAARAGAILCENTRVKAIDQAVGKEGFQLTTSQGTLQADTVLLATNGYTGPLIKPIQRRIFTVGSYMITTEPLPEALQNELNPNNRVVYDTKWFLNYFRLTPDGRMTMGGRNNLSPKLDVVESAKNLHAAMLHIFPQLQGYPITHTWSGQLGITFDLMPHIGQINGIHYAFGYGGHGVALSGYLGKQVAELMLGKIQRSPFAEIPCPTSIFYHGKAWFLPIVAAYYRFLDRVS